MLQFAKVEEKEVERHRQIPRDFLLLVWTSRVGSTWPSSRHFLMRTGDAALLWSSAGLRPGRPHRDKSTKRQQKPFSLDTEAAGRLALTTVIRGSSLITVSFFGALIDGTWGSHLTPRIFSSDRVNTPMITQRGGWPLKKNNCKRPQSSETCALLLFPDVRAAHPHSPNKVLFKGCFDMEADMLWRVSTGGNVVDPSTYTF